MEKKEELKVKPNKKVILKLIDNRWDVQIKVKDSMNQISPKDWKMIHRALKAADRKHRYEMRIQRVSEEREKLELTTSVNS